MGAPPAVSQPVNLFLSLEISGTMLLPHLKEEAWGEGLGGERLPNNSYIVL